MTQPGTHPPFLRLAARLRAGLGGTFRSLANRNYRLFFFGQGLSLIGTWMQQIAMSWLVYRLTHSPLMLGVVGFAGQLPMLLLMPVAGVLTDRWERRRVLVATQALSLVQALAIAILTWTGGVQIWELLLLSATLGAINAFDMPARQAFTLEMVDRKEDLANAIALNSSLFNGSRLIGPTLAGVLIGWVGEGACFFLNAVSYVAVLAALLAMRLAPARKPAAPKAFGADLAEGVRYAFGFLPIRNILLLLSLGSLIGAPYMVLMPVFAKDVLHGGPDTLGLLMASSGVGALLGAMLLAARKSVRGLSPWIPIGAGLFGLGLAGFSWTRDLAWAAPCLALAGFGMIVNMAASNTILQTVADEDKRGRLMSLYALAFAGTAPLGSLFAGALSDRIGAPLTLRVSGLVCVAGAALFARQLPRLRALIRPIYRQKGILPAVAEGLQTATEPAPPAGR